MKIYLIHDANGYARYETTTQDGVPVFIPEGLEATEISEPVGAPPFSGAAYHVPSMTWVDRRTLDDHKTRKWQEIKAARQSTEFGGFIWDGSVFDSDAISQSRIQGAVVLATSSPSFEITWTLADNTSRLLNGTDMLNVGVALGEHVAMQHDRARILRTQLESASTIEAIESIVW